MNRQNNATLLFLAMGQIEDSLVNEAKGLTFKRSIPLWKRTAVAAAAVIALVISIGVIVNTIGGDDLTRYPDSSYEKLQLAMETSNSVSVLDADEVDLFNGKPSIIWQRRGSDKYYVTDTDISEDMQAINELLPVVGEEQDRDTASVNTYKLWISYGNGYVVSPELKYTAGNVGFGELFNYTAEIQPNDELAELLASVIAPTGKE